MNINLTKIHLTKGEIGAIVGGTTAFIASGIGLLGTGFSIIMAMQDRQYQKTVMDRAIEQKLYEHSDPVTFTNGNGNTYRLIRDDFTKKR